MANQTLSKYAGVGEVQLDGLTLAEATSVNVSIAPNSTPVRTMKKGLAGRSRGPVESTIRVSSAIPKAGFEGAFLEKCIDDADVTIIVILANKRYAFDGWINATDFEFNTNASAGANFTVMAGKPRKL